MPNGSKGKISFRLDSDRQKGMQARCEELGCCPSDYLRGLIDLDLEEQAQEGAKEESKHAKQAGSNHNTYYLHRSNPDIKLIDRIMQNGQTYYIDREGRKWLMDTDRTLIGTARIVS